MTKKVFVSGCFDMLHSGHVAFFREAAQYGDLYVALGSDKTVFDLKGRETVNDEHERLFMVKGVAWVKDAFISRGSGILDFESELREMHPDYFVVNADGNTPEKRALCNELGVEYVILSVSHTNAYQHVLRLPCANVIIYPIALTWRVAGSINPLSRSIIPVPL